MSYGKDTPADGVASVTPSDTVDFVGGPIAALYVGGAGNISVLCVDGTSGVFVNVQAGSILPIALKRVNASGTTASNMLGLRQ